MHSSSGSDMPMSSADSVMAGKININMGTDDVYSIDSTSSSTYTSTPNDSSHHAMRDHEISTNPSVRSSSCSGAAFASLEEGQGESRCDQHVRTSSNSRTRDGERSCNMDIIARRGGKFLGSVNRHSSCFCKDIEQEQEYFQQILGTSSYGWTDEKHSSYLDSMEADFLRSVMFRRHVHEESTSSELSDSASSQEAIKSCKEFKICQNGRWRPMGTGVQPSYVAGPVRQLAVAVKNPWIKRFRPSSKNRVTLLQGSIVASIKSSNVA